MATKLIDGMFLAELTDRASHLVDEFLDLPPQEEARHKYLLQELRQILRETAGLFPRKPMELRLIKGGKKPS